MLVWILFTTTDGIKELVDAFSFDSMMRIGFGFSGKNAEVSAMLFDCGKPTLFETLLRVGVFLIVLSFLAIGNMSLFFRG